MNDLSDWIGIAITLLVLGGLAMSQVPGKWQSYGSWLALSWIGIPAFVILLAHPTIGTGVLVAMCIWAFARQP